MMDFILSLVNWNFISVTLPIAVAIWVYRKQTIKQKQLTFLLDIVNRSKRMNELAINSCSGINIP